ncbi:MAG: hypothetical protein NTX45_08475 [Proteobacteria bacterium]|nr:hypothetical protein [Pseudomonadota bacterium]
MNIESIEQQTPKSVIHSIVDAQPDDASFDEILRELTFNRMVEKGLADSRAGRVVSEEDALRRVKSWGR